MYSLLMKTTNRVTLPTLLSFDGKGGFKPGRGEAGWTVYGFDTVAERDAFMKTHGYARMPCWDRIDA